MSKVRTWRDTRADVVRLIRAITDHAAASAALTEATLAAALAADAVAIEIRAKDRERVTRATVREIRERNIPSVHPSGHQAQLDAELWDIWTAAGAEIFALVDFAKTATADRLAAQSGVVASASIN